MSNNVLPIHCVNWIWNLYAARDEKLGFANEAFRFSLKTTLLTGYFTSYFIGCHPERTNLFIQDNDVKATKNSKFVADHIAHSNEWKLFFPSVRPDTSMGWGAQGYYVKRTDMDYGEWRRGSELDPTLVGAGYKSSDILGMHPTGLLIIDDIHNYNNTRSQRELNAVLGTWEATIKPARVKETIEIYNYTPWVDGDIGDKIKANRYYRHITTQICEGGDITKPIWAEKYGTKELERLKEDHTPSEWARMFLCDKTAMRGVILKREWLEPWYSHLEVKDDWPVIIGVDYASIHDIQETKGRDYFALAVLRKVPGGGLILVDGVRAHFTQGQAEDEVVSWADLYEKRLHRIGVEAIGKGEEFYYSLLKMAKMPLRKNKVGNMSKALRVEKGLAPLFRKGRLYLSDEPGNEFIKHFVDEWLAWDGTGRTGDDCLDAVYHAVLCAKGNVLPAQFVDADVQGLGEKVMSNPMLAFSRR